MMKLKRTIRFGSYFLLAGMFVFVFVSTSLVHAASQTQSYHSSSSLALGTVVSTTGAGSNNLTTATLQNEPLMVGVVANTKDGVVGLQQSGTNVTVATTGQATLLVTDATGNINSGDNLVISPIAGVATKDTTDTTAKKYVAIASQSFSSSSSNSQSVSVTYADGSTKSVDVGTIQVKLNLVNRPPNPNTQNQNFILALLTRLIGKPVNKAKLIAATVVLVTTLLITFVLLQGSIRGSFVALGRNPLSKPIILSNLFRVVALSILILEVGIAISYMILVV